MKVDGQAIAQNILDKLAYQVKILKKKNVVPQLAVILIDHDTASLVYVERKKKVGERIGVKVSDIRLEASKIDKKKLFSIVEKLNKDEKIHGIIIQRPVSLTYITKDNLESLIIPQKDVDGFHPQSKFIPPISLAVLEILKWIHQDIAKNHLSPLYPFLNYQLDQKLKINLTPRTTSQISKLTLKEGETGGKYHPNFQIWLKNQKIIILGRGETAGGPISKFFQKMDIEHLVAHSQTQNIEKLCLASNIIISCVGKPNIVRHNMVTDKTILIGVGLHFEGDELKPDYNQEEVENKVAYYTPVPKGIGPVNVAFLFDNLIKACQNNLKG